MICSKGPEDEEDQVGDRVSEKEDLISAREWPTIVAYSSIEHYLDYSPRPLKQLLQ